MKILVTGASGFLGSKIFSHLSRGNNNIFGVSSEGSETTLACDLTNQESVSTLLEGLEPDCIIHCAAHVPKKTLDYRNEEMGKSNLLMTKNVLDESSCPLVYISSMTVYGDSKGGLVPESQACDPTNHYAQSKLRCERLIKESGRNGFAVRIPGLFGLPRASGLVYNLMLSAVMGKDVSLPQVPIAWSGMHVADAVEAILTLIPKSTQKFSALNVGCSGKISVNQLVYLVNDIYGTKIETKVQHPVFELDLSRYQKLTGLPTTNIRQSLQRFGDELDF